MLYLTAVLHTLGVNLTERVQGRIADPERGSETIEKVLWAVAVIAIVGIVVAVLTTYVTNQAAKIA